MAGEEEEAGAGCGRCSARRRRNGGGSRTRAPRASRPCGVNTAAGEVVGERNSPSLFFRLFAWTGMFGLEGGGEGKVREERGKGL